MASCRFRRRSESYVTGCLPDKAFRHLNLQPEHATCNLQPMTLTTYAGKHVVILGLARQGTALARFLCVLVLG